MSFTPDPKDGPRVKASAAEWAAIRAEKVDGQPCRVFPELPATEAHHIVPKSLRQEGDDVADNIAGLSAEGHKLVTEMNLRALSKFRRSMTRQELAYVVERKGRAWLDARYPWDAFGTVRRDASLSEGAGHVEPPQAPSESDETCPRCKGKGKVHKMPKPAPALGRIRRTYSVAIPKDSQEDGADVLDTLIQSAREALRDEMGWTDSVPAYFVLSAVLVDFTNSRPVKEAA